MEQYNYNNIADESDEGLKHHNLRSVLFRSIRSLADNPSHSHNSKYGDVMSLLLTVMVEYVALWRSR